MADISDPATPPDPLYAYVATLQRKIWADQVKAHPLSPQEAAALHAQMNLLVDVTARLHRAGVRMVAGTDAAAFRLVGRSLHRELGNLVRAGFTPLEALQTATINPAQAFDRVDERTVAPGKRADLVLLDADPLRDIANTQKIAVVVRDGRLFRRADPDALMAEAKRLAAAN